MTDAGSGCAAFACRSCAPGLVTATLPAGHDLNPKLGVEIGGMSFASDTGIPKYNDDVRQLDTENMVSKPNTVGILVIYVILLISLELAIDLVTPTY